MPLTYAASAAFFSGTRSVVHPPRRAANAIGSTPFIGRIEPFNDSSPTNNVVLGDCSGNPAADYAEQYPVAQGISYGDVVVPGTRRVRTQQGDIIVQLVRSGASYQEPVVGIVSDNDGDFTSAGYNIDEADNPMPIALVGRVPVNVTDENGSIHPGDFLTTSSTPGHAMKATRPGRVIGMALGAFEGGLVGESGQVMVQVLNSWWGGPKGFDAESRIAELEARLARVEMLLAD